MQQLSVQELLVTVQATAINHRGRIAQGVRNSELTRVETKNLINKEKDIRRDTKEARADGLVTRGERIDAGRDQPQASPAI